MRNGLTHAEAGKLGAEKTKETIKLKRLQRIEEYNNNPTRCKHCDVGLDYEKKHNKFCSKSCSATHNNQGVDRHKNNKNRRTKNQRKRNGDRTRCVFCKIELTKQNGTKFCNSTCYNYFQLKLNRKDLPSRFCTSCNEEISAINKKFCDRGCQNDYQHFIVGQQLTKNSKLTTRPIRIWLLKERDYKCEVCGLLEWQNKPIPIDVDHIDGDHTNNLLSNLRLICLNCHGQTPTYRAKNWGNGRHSRMERYHEGKSY